MRDPSSGDVEGFEAGEGDAFERECWVREVRGDAGFAAVAGGDVAAVLGGEYDVAVLVGGGGDFDVDGVDGGDDEEEE